MPFLAVRIAPDQSIGPNLGCIMFNLSGFIHWEAASLKPTLIKTKVAERCVLKLWNHTLGVVMGSAGGSYRDSRKSLTMRRKVLFGTAFAVSLQPTMAQEGRVQRGLTFAQVNCSQ